MTPAVGPRFCLRGLDGEILRIAGSPHTAQSYELFLRLSTARVRVVFLPEKWLMSMACEAHSFFLCAF